MPKRNSDNTKEKESQIPDAEIVSAVKSSELPKVQFDRLPMLINEASPISIDGLSPEQQSRAIERANKLDIRNTTEVLAFGVEAQQGIDKLTTSILQRVKTREVAEVGQSLTDLIQELKGADPDAFANRIDSFIAKLPIIGNMYTSVEGFINRFQTVAQKMDYIVAKLNDEQDTLNRDITMLDALYDENVLYLENLKEYTAAAAYKREQAKVELEELRQKALDSKDPIDVQAYNDFADALNRLDVRVGNMVATVVATIQFGPQIRIVQNNDIQLVESIQTSKTTAIPLWQRQVVLALSLLHQKSGVELQKTIREYTNEMLKRNAGMIRDQSELVAIEGQKLILELETLHEVNVKLLETVDTMIRIRENGQKERALFESEVKQLPKKLQERALQAGSSRIALPPAK